MPLYVLTEDVSQPSSLSINKNYTVAKNVSFSIADNKHLHWLINQTYLTVVAWVCET